MEAEPEAGDFVGEVDEEVGTMLVKLRIMVFYRTNVKLKVRM